MGPFVFVPPLIISKITLGKLVKPITNLQLGFNPIYPNGALLPMFTVDLTHEKTQLTDCHLHPVWAASLTIFQQWWIGFTPGNFSHTIPSFRFLVVVYQKVSLIVAVESNNSAGDSLKWNQNCTRISVNLHSSWWYLDHAVRLPADVQHFSCLMTQTGFCRLV